MRKVFAQSASDIIGTVQSPLSGNFASYNTGIVLFITNILRLMFVVAGVFALFNIIIGGFSYMSSGGDVKKTTEAWDRIWYSLLGLVIIIGSFALAAVFGYLIFGDAGFILNPRVYGPGD